METNMRCQNNCNASRMNILKRFLRTIVCLIAFELLKTLAYTVIFVQFAITLVTGGHAEPLRNFSNKMSTYAYQILRYATLNSNRRPFPFSDLPGDYDCKPQSSNIDYS